MKTFLQFKVDQIIHETVIVCLRINENRITVMFKLVYFYFNELDILFVI